MKPIQSVFFFHLMTSLMDHQNLPGNCLDLPKIKKQNSKLLGIKNIYKITKIY